MVGYPNAHPAQASEIRQKHALAAKKPLENQYPAIPSPLAWHVQ
jgi:hypothetical protein